MAYELTELASNSKQREMTAEFIEEFRHLNLIAVLKEEDFVIRSLMRGKGKQWIIEEIRTRHPEENITLSHLEKFLVDYKDIFKNELLDVQKGYVRRILKTKEGLTNGLIDLATTAQELATKYDSEGDNTNAVAALRTAADIFMKFAKVEGLATDQPEVNINMQMDKVVTEITSGESAFKNAVLKVLDKKSEEPSVLEAEFTTKDDRK